MSYVFMFLSGMLTTVGIFEIAVGRPFINYLQDFLMAVSLIYLALPSKKVSK